MADSRYNSLTGGGGSAPAGAPSLATRLSNIFFTNPDTIEFTDNKKQVIIYRMESTRVFPPEAKKVFEGKIFSIWQWPQRRFDGSMSVYEGISRPDSAFCLGILPDKQILIVEDEQPDRSAVLTPAGGQMEKEEDPADGAKREFLEETGYEVGQLIPWHSYQPSGRAQYFVHSFIGRNLKKVGEPQNSPGEKITLKKYSFDDFLLLGQDNKLRDWLLRITLLEALLDSQKRQELAKLFYD